MLVVNLSIYSLFSSTAFLLQSCWYSVSHGNNVSSVSIVNSVNSVHSVSSLNSVSSVNSVDNVNSVIIENSVNNVREGMGKNLGLFRTKS